MVLISLDVGGGRIHKYIQGINHVSGEEALAFARERDSYESGDIHRNMNQQAVMKAIIEKATSSTTILNKYGDILSGLQGYIRTNFSEREISLSEYTSIPPIASTSSLTVAKLTFT